MVLKRIALGAAGFVIAGMMALTVSSGLLSAPAAADEADPSAPDESSVTVDRDPHSNSPVMPTSICADPTLACEPGETH
jgi:3-oxoacyl-(acyl-carrier-protein) synthase